MSLTYSQKFLTFSTVTEFGFVGCFAFLPWDLLTSHPLLLPSMAGTAAPDPKIQNMLACLCMGWGVGKYVALQAGPKAIKQFCQISTVTFLPLVILLVGSGGIGADALLHVGLWVGYAYFGFFDESGSSKVE
jgi:hypothetical protein